MRKRPDVWNVGRCCDDGSTRVSGPRTFPLGLQQPHVLYFAGSMPSTRNKNANSSLSSSMIFLACLPPPCPAFVSASVPH